MDYVLAVLLMTTNPNGTTTPHWEVIGHYRNSYACELAKNDYQGPSFGLKCMKVDKN
jgi:hypothetical protein